MYNIYGESFAFLLFIYPAIILGTSFYGTVKREKWLVIPAITFIVLILFFNIVTNDFFLDFLVGYTLISLAASYFTHLIKKSNSMA
ncbi:DUF2651 family protein [Bacillus massilinigeriensis]|uniref:DUF2651 family protein n=1 Tax=Bacillus massilionigeriensis TaxID=1805475 RepID=UPI00096AF67D